MTLHVPTHKSVLIQLLHDIYADTTLGPFLGFKGGTAAYVFYGLNRFSVDLDFDLLDEGQGDHVFGRLERIARTYGELRDKKIKRFNLLIVLSYEEKAQNIKIEVNRRSFGSRFELKSYMGISMLVMVKEDMFAHKLVAMHERMGGTNRDIFDVWYFLKSNWSITTEIVEKRTGVSFLAFLKKCIAILERQSDRSILSGMGELLDPQQKAWAKEHLRKDTIFLLKLRLENEKKL